jgi:hypothetical protein
MHKRGGSGTAAVLIQRRRRGKLAADARTQTLNPPLDCKEQKQLSFLRRADSFQGLPDAHVK